MRIKNKQSDALHCEKAMQCKILCGYAPIFSVKIDFYLPFRRKSIFHPECQEDDISFGVIYPMPYKVSKTSNKISLFSLIFYV
jgi:hypothetical protein